MTIELTLSDLKKLNKSTFEAFIESGDYAYTYTKACDQFGRTNIDLLITNGLLENTSDLIGKKRFLLSDITTAFSILKNK